MPLTEKCNNLTNILDGCKIYSNKCNMAIWCIDKLVVYLMWIKTITVAWNLENTCSTDTYTQNKHVYLQFWSHYKISQKNFTWLIKFVYIIKHTFTCIKLLSIENRQLLYKTVWQLHIKTPHTYISKWSEFLSLLYGILVHTNTDRSV